MQKILSGEKTVEVRKTKPKCDIPFKCYIYQTGNGGIVGEAMCRYVTRITYSTGGIDDFGDSETTGLSWQQLIEYGQDNIVYGWSLYAVKKYEKPKALSEFGLKRPPQSWCYIK